ncbi:MAG: hypothetical protein B6D37_15480 [Sphingobacteriales bacterium UTBCD1]|jgi:FkbM family methyltransferase|nr:MAG: hypothetical protein B6D37_15480 [Sphingobacteriales bacterium UTBCD1]
MKELIRNILKRFGYDIVKTGVPYIPKTNKNDLVNVGKFKVLMPGNNVQRINYRVYPELNDQLGRLACLLHKKYPAMTVVDVGANVGDTIAVIKSFTNASIIGIEGDEISFGFLEENVKQFSDVSVIKTFLGEKHDEIKADFKNTGWNATIVPAEGGSQKVLVRTLDEIIGKDYNGLDIKLLKIDVEGFDTIVLRGAQEVIKKNKPVVFFEYNPEAMKLLNEDGFSTLLSFRDKGYDKVIFFDHKGTLFLVTSLKNLEELTCLHEYISSSRNLLGYYDIVIFNEADVDIAIKYSKEERGYL